MLNKKSVSKDIVYTISANCLVVGASQLLIYPMLAANMASDEYGTLLTSLGVLEIIILSLGNNLCNSRLVRNGEYVDADSANDFGLILLWVIPIGMLVACLLLVFWLRLDAINAVPLVAYCGLAIMRAYNIVAFRIALDFKGFFFACVFQALGLIVGICAFLFGSGWWIVFLLSELFELIYIRTKNRLLTFGGKKSALFNASLKTFVFMSLSGVVGSFVTFFDRIFLYPFLGATAVSVYTVAVFFGKSLAVVTNPLSTLLLSYLSSGTLGFTTKSQLKLAALIAGACICMGIVSALIGVQITGLFYPSLVQDAAPYVLVGNCAAIAGIAANMSSAAVTKYAPSQWLLVIAAMRLMSYVALGIVFIHYFDLLGYCVAVLICNLSIFIVNFVVGMFYVSKGKRTQCPKEDI